MKLLPRMLLFCLAMNVAVWAAEIQYVGTIVLKSQDELFFPSRIAVTEDDLFLIPDQRDANIKVYDQSGSRTQVWGTRGHGPGEFITPWPCDYRRPYLVLYDLGRFEVMRFRREGPATFQYEAYQKGVLNVWDVRLWRDKVVIAGLVRGANGRRDESHDVYSLDLSTGELDGLMPSHMKYGFRTDGEYRARYKNIAPLGLISHIHVHRDVLYHVWQARLNVVRIDLKSRTTSSFGKTTALFREPYVTDAMKKHYGERGASRIWEKELQRFSFVVGVFASDDFIGVLYENYHAGSSSWKPILQLYDPQGSLKDERMLTEVQFYDQRPIPFAFKEEGKALFLMSGIMDSDGGIRHEIVHYRIR